MTLSCRLSTIYLCSNPAGVNKDGCCVFLLSAVLGRCGVHGGGIKAGEGWKWKQWCGKASEASSVGPFSRVCCLLASRGASPRDANIGGVRSGVSFVVGNVTLRWVHTSGEGGEEQMVFWRLKLREAWSTAGRLRL